MTNIRPSDLTTPLYAQSRNRVEKGRYLAGDVLDLIESLNQGPLIVDSVSLPLKERYRLFCRDRMCRSCDMPIDVAILERNTKQSEAWHLHFYGVRDNKLVVFTVDHVVPRSLGGEDHLKNYQTFCFVCNQKKGNVCTDPFAAAQIRLRGKHG